MQNRRLDDMAESEDVEECNMPDKITMTEHNEIRGVMDMLICGAEEIFEAEGHMDIRFPIELKIDEIILQAEVDDEILTLQELSNVHEESWILVKQRSKGKAQKERTRLIREKSSEIYDNGTDIVEFVEEHKAVQIEIKEELYTQPHYAKHGRDAGHGAIHRLGWLVSHDAKAKTQRERKAEAFALGNHVAQSTKGRLAGEAKSTVQKRTEQQENAKMRRRLRVRHRPRQSWMPSANFY